MDFEYNPLKSSSNKVKHGIDFEEATELWKDNRAFSFLLSSSTEIRYLLVARKAEKHWSVIYTHRNERIRIISARRARPKEVNDYENR